MHVGKKGILRYYWNGKPPKGPPLHWGVKVALQPVGGWSTMFGIFNYTTI